MSRKKDPGSFPDWTKNLGSTNCSQFPIQNQCRFSGNYQGSNFEHLCRLLLPWIHLQQTNRDHKKTHTRSLSKRRTKLIRLIFWVSTLYFDYHQIHRPQSEYELLRRILIPEKCIANSRIALADILLFHKNKIRNNLRTEALMFHDNFYIGRSKGRHPLAWSLPACGHILDRKSLISRRWSQLPFLPR